ETIKVPGSSVVEIKAPTPTITPPPFIPEANWEAPIIPLPFALRYPLEDMIGSPLLPEPIASGYYGGETLEVLQDWISRNPDKLHTYTKTTRADGTIVWTDK